MIDTDMLDSPGVRAGNETLVDVPAEETIRPLRDQILVEPLDWQPSRLIQTVYTGKPLRGVVRAVGPGHYRRKYDGPKGKRTKSWLGKHFQPTEVKVGDTVELGGLELGGYLFMRIRWGGKEMVICREADICAVVQ